MIGITHFGLFVITALLVNFTPGADTMYIVSRSVSQGKKAGLYSVLGISSGILVHTFLAAVGLSLLLTTSVMLFTAVKLIGAGYLVYLGIRMLMQRSSSFELAHKKEASYKKIYVQGLITNVTNPKVALFFISFIPQFIAPNQIYGSLPFIILGLTFVLTGTLWCLLVAFFSALLTNKLRENPKVELILSKITGLIFIVMGIKLFQTKAA